MRPEDEHAHHHPGWRSVRLEILTTEGRREVSGWVHWQVEGLAVCWVDRVWSVTHCNSGRQVIAYATRGAAQTGALCLRGPDWTMEEEDVQGPEHVAAVGLAARLPQLVVPVSEVGDA